MPEIINSENTSPESLVTPESLITPELPIVMEIRRILEDPDYTPEMREKLLVNINEKLLRIRGCIDTSYTMLYLSDLGIGGYFDDALSSWIQRNLIKAQSELDTKPNL
jgi:hypothetical protein